MALEATIEPGHTWSSGDDVDVDTLNKTLQLARAVVPTPIAVKHGGTGGSTAQAAQKSVQALGRLEGWVEYTDDGVAVSLGVLPADSFVIDVVVHVTTAFNGAGAKEIEVGWSSDADALGVAFDVSSTGVGYPTVGANDGYNSTQQNVEVLFTDTGGTATAGKVIVLIYFAQVTSEP